MDLSALVSRYSPVFLTRRHSTVPTRYEQILHEFDSQTEGLSSIFAEAGRRARLQTEVHCRREIALRNVAAGVVAPLLGAYVIWLLREAQRQEIETLWFLGRDGQILLELAKILAPALRVKVDARYLHASRQAWNLPAVACGAHADLSWIWDATDDLSVQTLLSRVGLEPSDIADDLENCGLLPSQWTLPLGTAQAIALFSTMQRRGVRERIWEIAREGLPLMVSYFEQIGLLNAPRAAMVEVQGHGSLQESLTAVLSYAGAPPPQGLYFAFRPTKRDQKMSTPITFLNDKQREGLIPGFGVFALEAFCAADHGTLCGFTLEGDTVKPVFGEVNRPVLDWGLALLRRTVSAWAYEVTLNLDLVNSDADVRSAVTATLRTFWTQPTAEEAATWGAFPWEDGLGTQTRFLPLARAYTLGDILGTLEGRQISPAHRAEWLEGSMAITPGLYRLALRFAHRFSQR